MGIRVDDSKWQDAMDLLAALVPDASKEAGVECAEEVQSSARSLLALNAHAPGSYSKSPPGAPPGEITGELGASIFVTPASDGAMVGPTTEYGREQELGGPMRGHMLMKWINEGGRWERHLVILPPRPYLKPATDKLVTSGKVTEIYIKHLEEILAML